MAKKELTVKAHRLSADLTQEAVARGLEVSLVTYRRWEISNRIPKKRERVRFLALIENAKNS